MRYSEGIEFWKTSPTASRTITETDEPRFAALTEDFMGFHVDKEFAKSTLYAGWVAHGLSGLPRVERLKVQPLCYVASMDSLGWTTRFRAPICLGDTLTGHFRGAEGRETKKPDRSIFILTVQLLNPRREGFEKGEHARMIKCQPLLPLPARCSQLCADAITVRCTHVIYSGATPMGQDDVADLDLRCAAHREAAPVRPRCQEFEAADAVFTFLVHTRGQRALLAPLYRVICVGL